MLDEKDLQAIRAIMTDSEQRMTAKIGIAIANSEQRNAAKIDEAVQASEQRTAAKIDEAIQASEQRTAAKIDAAESRILQRAAVLMESYFDPKFNLLAEGLQSIQEKLDRLPSPDRFATMEDRITVLEAGVRILSREIEELKKAQ